LRRLGFSLFLLKDGIRKDCLEKGRFFNNEDFEKIGDENEDK